MLSSSSLFVLGTAGFMAQFGIHGDPSQAAIWRGKVMQDDPVVESNKPGYVSSKREHS